MTAYSDYVLESTSQPSTLVELLRWRTIHQPNQQAYTFLVDGEAEEVSITYEELDRQARAIGALLQSLEAKGERALLLYPPGLDYIAAFFGCLYAGVIAVPAYPPRRNRPMPRIHAILADAQATLALTTTQILSDMERRFVHAPDLKELRWLVTDNVDRGLVEEWRNPAISSDSLAFLQYTSGSTATPKGVMVSHGNLLHNQSMIQQGYEHTEQSIILGWLPLYHDMGLIGNVLQPLYIGGRCILMSPAAFLQKPFRWLQAISRYKASTSGGPNFAYDLCVRKITPEQRATLDLSSWSAAFNGSEPVRAETLERFTENFAPCGFRWEAFYPCYGLAEGTLIVSGGKRATPPVVRSFHATALEKKRVVKTSVDNNGIRPLVGCGQTLLDQKIIIVNPESLTRCSPDQIGEIWVKGSSVAQGYWNRPEETKDTFQAYLKDTGEGPFLRTGDLGFLREDELFVTGRLKDLIIIRGRNYYPQDIELTVEKSHPALSPGCGAAFSVDVEGKERLVIVQEVERRYRNNLNVDEVVSNICQVVNEHHELQVYAVVLVKPMQIPKTSSGKIQRHACRERFLMGSFDTVGEWSQQIENSQSHTFSEEYASDKQPSAYDKQSYSQEQSKTVEEIQTWLVKQISRRLKIAPNKIDVQQPFIRYNIESVEAVGISGELEDWLGRKMSPTLVYDYPTIEALARHLAGEPDASMSVSKVNAVEGTDMEPIAIIGIGCRFPSASNPEEFWQLLRDGVDAITEAPAERWDFRAPYDMKPTALDKMNTFWGGFLEQVDQFDPIFFGIAPREAESMDPQQRLTLEVAWEALENAGLAPERLSGTRTGVFIGISSNDYGRLLLNDSSLIDAYVGTGNALSIVANRISYLFNFRGPSLAIDTACSSSLVAVHLACQSLRNGESNLALAGGVNLLLSPELTVTFSQAGMLAADGRCKTFDARADGYVRGEGCGIIALKRLSDALKDGDNILALIRGSAVNQDGRSNGLTAPNGPSQQAVIRKAIENAGLVPAQISYVEAHGTGTSLGDPIETNSLKEVLTPGRSPEQLCWIGSVKTNVGHLEAAAGIAGLIKVVLSLQHQEIPPHLHLKQLNPQISLAGTSLSVPTKQQPWPESIEGRFAGVSSFGFGGTNAHVVLEAAPVSTPTASDVSRPMHIFTLSAKSENALRALAYYYEEFLVDHPAESIADICFTANTGRSHFAHRLAVTAESLVQLRERLGAFSAGNRSAGLVSGHVQNQNSPNIVFLFTGQGSQYIGMGRQLYETQPTFRKALDKCDELLRPYLDEPLLSVLYPEPGGTSPLDETAYTQPALFALEYALAELWQSWGIEPSVVMGHSVGEYVAACIAGVFSLEDGLKLIAERARLMQELPQDGEMVAVFAEEERVAAAIQTHAQEVSIAAINGPKNIVISGQRQTVEAVITDLEAEGVKTRKLRVSHAFHSPLMEPTLTAFEQKVQEVTYSTPRIGIISNVTGHLATDEIATPEYWVNHIQQPVRFAAGISTLHQEGYEVFVEIGPKPTLSGLGRNCLPGEGELWLPSLCKGRDDWQQMLTSLGALYIRGMQVDWSGFDRDYLRRRVALPTYPFQRQRYWIDMPESEHQAAMSSLQEKAHLSSLNLLHQEDTKQLAGQTLVQQHELLQKFKGVPAIDLQEILIPHIQTEVAKVLRREPSHLPGPQENFFDMGMDSLMAIELKNQLEVSLGSSIPSTLFFEYPTIESLSMYLINEVFSLDLSSESDTESQKVDQRTCYVVGDKFLNFCEYDDVVSCTQLLNQLNDNHIPAKRYVFRQGVSEEWFHTLREKLAQVINPQEIEIEEKVSRRIKRHFVHKVKPENVLITIPEQVNENQYIASLAIDDRCAEMSDHVTGKHIQGFLLIEAARQMFMASSEIYKLNDEQRGKYSYALQKFEVNFMSFLFPVEVDIKLTFMNQTWDMEHISLRGTAKIEFHQMGKIACEIICEGVGYPTEWMKILEEQQALKCYNFIRGQRKYGANSSSDVYNK